MSSADDGLATRMKGYEAATEHRLMPRLPAFARLDGRGFSRFTRNTEKPFSPLFRGLMLDLTRWLTEEVGALVGYSQSDELTVCWLDPTGTSEPLFGGRTQKLASSLAAMASVKFNALLAALREVEVAVDLQGANKGSLTTTALARSGLDPQQLPTFDCRVWNVPTREEAANVFVWRQLDAARNSVQMAARAVYSPSECFERSTSELQELLFRRGINWNDYPVDFRRGTFIRKRAVFRRFSTAELDSLPPRHDARRNPDLVVERREFALEDLWLTKISNREGVLFEGEAPEATSSG